MSTRASAARYARALFEVAAKEGGLERIDSELFSLAALFSSHEDLRKALLNPVVPTSAKRAIVSQLIPADAPPPFVKLLGLLGERDRFELVPDLAAAFRERLLEHQQVVRAEVVTAEPLDDTRRQQLEASLAKAAGRQVALTSRVDPAIIGGMIARIGSTVYDASVSTQLTRMREALIARM